MMKKILFCLQLCLLLCAVSSYAKTEAQSLDQIVAIVNDDAITQSELQQALVVVKAQIAQNQVTQPSDNTLQKQVLDQLINKKLQMQIAKRADIDITNDELNKTIANVADRNNMTVNALYQQINRSGIPTAEYREEIREQLTLQKLQQKEIIPHITITPQEVSDFMHSQNWQDNGTKEYRLDDILVPLSDTPSPNEIAEAKRHAEAILLKLHQGQRFRDAALAESGDNHALQGGDLGWRQLPEIPSAFADQVAHMQINDIAGPIQAPNGFHLIRLAAVRNKNAKTAKLDRKQIEQLLLQRKFEEAAQNWISKLRSQSFIKINLVG